MAVPKLFPVAVNVRCTSSARKQDASALDLNENSRASNLKASKPQVPLPDMYSPVTDTPST